VQTSIVGGKAAGGAQRGVSGVPPLEIKQTFADKLAEKRPAEALRRRVRRMRAGPRDAAIENAPARSRMAMHDRFSSSPVEVPGWAPRGGEVHRRERDTIHHAIDLFVIAARAEGRQQRREQ